MFILCKNCFFSHSNSSCCLNKFIFAHENYSDIHTIYSSRIPRIHNNVQYNNRILKQHTNNVFLHVLHVVIQSYDHKYYTITT